MDIKRLDDIIRNPSIVTADDIFELENLSNQYPFAQFLHVLLAKISNQYGNEQKDLHIHTAAIYASDRIVLKKVILDTNFQITLNSDDFLHYYEEPKPKSFLPPEIDQDEYQESADQIQKDIAYSDEKEDDSNELFEEVMKNLRILRSLRKQYEFLEKQESTNTQDVEIQKNEETIEKEDNNSNITDHEEEPIIFTETLETGQVTEGTSKNSMGDPAEFDETVENEKKRVDQENLSQDLTTDSNELTRKYQDDLISRFIEKDPDIKSRRVLADKETHQNHEDLSVVSTFLDENLVTENLANIFLRQGKTEKAIDIYKKLIWKFPQKKAYFAAQIEDLMKK